VFKAGAKRLIQFVFIRVTYLPQPAWLVGKAGSWIKITNIEYRTSNDEVKIEWWWLSLSKPR